MGKIVALSIVTLSIFIGVYTFISSSTLKQKLHTPHAKAPLPSPSAIPHAKEQKNLDHFSAEEQSAEFRMTLMYLHLISRLHCEEKGTPPTIKVLKDEMKRQKVTTYDAFFDSYPESGCGIRVSLNRYYLNQKPFKQDFQKVLHFPLSEEDRNHYKIQTP